MLLAKAGVRITLDDLDLETGDLLVAAQQIIAEEEEKQLKKMKGRR